MFWVFYFHFASKIYFCKKNENKKRNHA
jgi:hypothetical protein